MPHCIFFENTFFVSAVNEQVGNKALEDACTLIKLPRYNLQAVLLLLLFQTLVSKSACFLLCFVFICFVFYFHPIELNVQWYPSFQTSGFRSKNISFLPFRTLSISGHSFARDPISGDSISGQKYVRISKQRVVMILLPDTWQTAFLYSGASNSGLH